jgi:hypothetical protein
MKEAELQKRCTRNRKRSKRRAIYCPKHSCPLHSVSQKYQLFADQAEQLQQQGIARRNALMLIATQTTVLLEGDWLEAFWCDQCQDTKWYHIQKNDRIYEASIAPPELWQRVNGVISPHHNPSVSEFTQRHSRMTGYQGVKDFGFVN